MYYRIPTAEELSKTSYTLQDFIDNEPHVEVWDENWDVLQLYRQYSSQWRASGHGLYALDLNVFHHALDRKGVVGEEFDEYLEKLSTIESAALVQIRRNS